MKILYSRHFITDLDDIADYIRLDNPTRAIATVQVFTTISTLPFDAWSRSESLPIEKTPVEISSSPGVPGTEGTWLALGEAGGDIVVVPIVHEP